MSEQEVPRIATPVTAPALLDALRAAWTSAIGGDAPEAALELLVAQSAFEDGWWRACWNWNLGNQKHVTGDGRDFYFVACTEVLDGRVVKLKPPDPGCRFRAYSNLAEGAFDWLRLYEREYGGALTAAEAGDVVGFVHALRGARYFTDDEAHYLAQVEGVLAVVRRELAAAPPNPDGARELALAEAIDAGAEGLPPDTERSG